MKLYLIKRKGSSHFSCFGYARSRTWTSVRWVKYHLKRFNLVDWEVVTLNGITQTTICQPAKVFLADNTNPELSAVIVMKELGINVGYGELQNMVALGVLKPEIEEKAIKLLSEI